MKLTLEKRIKDFGARSINSVDFNSIINKLAQMNSLDSKYLEFLNQSDNNLELFFKSLIGSGDEVLTVGPTDDNICQAITSADASYLEFYEMPLFLPDSIGLAGKVTKYTKLIFMGNPNRFTGVVYSEKEIEDILNLSGDIILVLDESTYESSRITAIDLIKKYDNLALLRRFTNGQDCHFNYLIGSTRIIQIVSESKAGFNYTDLDFAQILSNLKNLGSRFGDIQKARQKMLYLSIRLRMFGLGCTLNPDYSLVINSNDSEKILLLFNKMGVEALNLAGYPGLSGNILLPFCSDLKTIQIVNMFATMARGKQRNVKIRKSLTICRSSESTNKIYPGKNRKTVVRDRLESNIVF